jgi:hypothetical protein
MKDLIFSFENMPVRIVATRNIPEILTSGLTVKETQQGRDQILPLWVAWELIQNGLARLIDEGVTDDEWTQIHYRERFQPIGKLSALPEDFYMKVFLRFLDEKKKGDQSYDRLRARFRDIIESRLGKITRISSADAEFQGKTLQPEEETLYIELHRLIEAWRKNVKEIGE